MIGRSARWRNEERGLLLTGLAGLAAAVVFACAGHDSEDHAGVATEPTTELAAASNPTGTAPSSSTTCERSTATDDNTAAVVTATNALVNALTPAQRTAIKYDKTRTNAEQWSNLPTTFVKRNGVKIGDMSPAAQAAAVALAEVAAGTTGSALLSELREADQFLVTDGRASATDYGRGLYYFSIHGTPSSTAAWMLQIAGHHIGYNFTYGGKCTSATPLFDGVEPTSWTDNTGKAHTPLEAQRAAMVSLLKSIAAKSDAKLKGTFSDLINGPGGGGPPSAGRAGGGGDTKYPASLVYPTGTTGRGVLVSTLASDQKALVKNAIEAWVKNVAEPVSTALLAVYESDESLAQTYVGYAGSSDLTTQSSYVRIDGPRVWIEVTIQGGIVYRNKVHYHTIWRDKVADYGAEYVTP